MKRITIALVGAIAASTLLAGIASAAVPPGVPPDGVQCGRAYAEVVTDSTPFSSAQNPGAHQGIAGIVGCDF